MRRALSVVVLLLTGCPAGDDNCGAFVDSSLARAEQRVASRRSGCSVDLDCALIRTGFTCVPGCDTAVLASSKAAVQSDLDDLGASECASTSCTATVACNPVHAVCRAGTCRTVDGTVDAGSGDGGTRDGG